MLAFQTMKRSRDDDSDSEDDRYLKKSRPFAFRDFRNGHTSFPSPSSLAYRPSFPPSPPQVLPTLEAISPAHSEHSDANSPASVQYEQPSFSSPRNADLDMDMDMDEDDVDIVGSQPPDSPFFSTFIRPPKLNFESSASHDSTVNSTGRIPTPIHPTFRMSTGGMGGLGYPSSGLAGGISMNSGNVRSGVPSAPVLQPPPTTWQQVQSDPDRSRRMPSPISEDEDLPDTPTAQTQSQLSRLSVTTNAERMDVEGCGEPSESGLPPPPGVVTTPTGGRKRSGALSSKGRFSMGYRDDCERCRQRVPGHYSHFL